MSGRRSAQNDRDSRKNIAEDLVCAEGVAASQVTDAVHFGVRDVAMFGHEVGFDRRKNR